MAALRARETNLRGQASTINAQLADREAYLKLADGLEGFLAQLRSSTQEAGITERQRVLRLLVKDVLIGPEKITIGIASPTAAITPPPDSTTPNPIRRVTIAQVIHCVGAWRHSFEQDWDRNSLTGGDTSVIIVASDLPREQQLSSGRAVTDGEHPAGCRSRVWPQSPCRLGVSKAKADRAIVRVPIV
jgi:hypothetical protein